MAACCRGQLQLLLCQLWSQCQGRQWGSGDAQLLPQYIQVVLQAVQTHSLLLSIGTASHEPAMSSSAGTTPCNYNTIHLHVWPDTLGCCVLSTSNMAVHFNRHAVA